MKTSHILNYLINISNKQESYKHNINHTQYSNTFANQN